MRYFKYLAVLAVLALPAAYSQAQVAIGVQIGPNYGLYNAPPVCEYGYYSYYPYACAPYGYWGPDWFVDGVFIGAGPWYRFYYVHPEIWRGYYGRFYGRGFDHFRDERGFRDRDFRGENRGFVQGGREFRGGNREFHGGDRGFQGGNREFRGGDRGFQGGNREFRGENRGSAGRGEFRGGNGFRAGGGFRSGGESHGRGGGGSRGENHGGRR